MTVDKIRSWKKSRASDSPTSHLILMHNDRCFGVFDTELRCSFQHGCVLLDTQSYCEKIRSKSSCAFSGRYRGSSSWYSPKIAGNPETRKNVELRRLCKAYSRDYVLNLQVQ